MAITPTPISPKLKTNSDTLRSISTKVRCYREIPLLYLMKAPLQNTGRERGGTWTTSPVPQKGSQKLRKHTSGRRKAKEDIYVTTRLPITLFISV